MKKPVKVKRKLTTVKAVKRSHIKSKKRVAAPTISYTRYIVIGFSVLVLVLVANLSIKIQEKPLVLGTSILIARDGIGNSGPGNQEDGSSVSGNNPEMPKPENVQNETDNAGRPPMPPDANMTQNTPQSANALVDCVGPDSKHFQTTFKNCYELNHNWGRKNFNFTDLHQQTRMPQQASFSGERKTRFPPEMGMQKLGDFQGNKDASYDGTMRPQFEKTRVFVRSNFHMTEDPTTNKVTITTSSGTQTLPVVPQEAIERVLQAKAISNVEQQNASGSADATTTLTQLNNQPVFAVNGFTNKKVFGIIPASFAKTVFVSAETGQIVKTNEAFFSKILETFSF